MRRSWEREGVNPRRAVTGLLLVAALASATVGAAARKEIEVKGKELICEKPPFRLRLPSELRLIHSFSQDHPKENSLTRVYFFIKERDRQVEEMLVLQIADRTNPQAEPIQAPSLRPYTERKMYLKGKKKGDVEIDYLLQSMVWNPEASSLQPLIKQGVVIPQHWALQGQFLFNYLGEHVVFVRYSRDVHTFGFTVSQTGDRWDKGSISGNEQKAYEIFKRSFLAMVDSIRVKPH